MFSGLSGMAALLMLYNIRERYWRFYIVIVLRNDMESGVSSGCDFRRWQTLKLFPALLGVYPHIIKKKLSAEITTKVESGLFDKRFDIRGSVLVCRHAGFWCDSFFASIQLGKIVKIMHRSRFILLHNCPFLEKKPRWKHSERLETNFTSQRTFFRIHHLLTTVIGYKNTRHQAAKSKRL